MFWLKEIQPKEKQFAQQDIVNFLNDAREGDPLEVKKYLDMGMDINVAMRPGITALRYAVANNHINVVTLLLRYPEVDVNVKDKAGGTPLTSAVAHNWRDIIPMLIMAGADTTVKKNSGRSIYDLAYGDEKTIKIIKNAIDDMEMKNISYFFAEANNRIFHKEYFSDLELAFFNSVYNGKIDVVKKCIKTGVNINARDYHNKTALMRAVEKDQVYYANYKIIIQLLLDAGIDALAKDDKGRTALDIARTHEAKKIIKDHIKADEELKNKSYFFS